MRLCCALVVASSACTFSPREISQTPTTLTDDSEQDFANHAVLADGVVTPWGTIEPAAFVPGGLRVRAYAGDQVADSDDFDAVVAKATTLLGSSYRQSPDDWTTSRPRGIGLSSSDNFTLIFEGEILLPLGQQRLEIDADDRAVAQVALDGKTFGERLFAHVGADSIYLDVRRTDWYPIRIAFGEDGGDAHLRLTLVQGTIRTPLGADSMRARITNDPGLVAFGFDGQALTAARGETVVPTVDAAFGGAAPAYDLDLGFDRFSLRHAGQLRVDTAGTYTFRAEIGGDNDDGFRIWIDGVLQASQWSGVSAPPSATVELEAGWHDFVVDYSDNVGNATIQLLMAGPGIPEAPIDPTRLRPAVARGLVAPFAQLAANPIADNATTELTLQPFGPSDGVIESVDYGFGIANHRFSDLAVEIADCGAAPRPLAISTNNPLIPSYFYFANDTSCAGTPLAPDTPWKYEVIDSAPGNDGLIGPALFDPILVASYHGGEREPFARAVSYVSQPRELPDAFAFGAVRVTTRGTGGRVEIAIRTGDDENELANAVWTIVESGQVPVMQPKQLVQYQLTASSDGWQYPIIDKVEIEYQTYE
ncbi:MAG TPA: PA14 domain-containing protein [Kofleriaceae bacterium]|nr:PA14 domain-containing protein [Kofleriaceae bacterium]